jgi:hypothetical protein
MTGCNTVQAFALDNGRDIAQDKKHKRKATSTWRWAL